MEEQQQHLQEVEEFSDGLLAELLAQSSLIPPEQLAEAQRRVAEWDVSNEIPLAPPCIVTPGQDSLAIGDAQVALSDAFSVDSNDWPHYSNGKLMVCDMLEPKIHREVDASMAGSGLIATPSGSFFYPGKTPVREQSPQLPCLPSHIMASSAVRSGPIDLVSSAGGEFIVAANRGAGTVHVIVPGVPSQVGALALRAAGSKRSMGVAIHHKTAYLTDGLTPRLTILDLVQWKVRHQTFPTGPLGSIAIAPDGQTLYICFYRNTDELGFLTVSTQDLRVRHLLNLPARKIVDAPGELLSLVPSGNLAYLVAGSQEIPHAYQLLGIDVAKKKIVKALPLGSLPLAIAFEPPKAWLPRKRNLRETLVEMGVITHQEIDRLLNTDPSMSPLDDPALDPAVLSQLPERLIRLMAIVPLYRQGQALHVAMVNPQDTTTRQLAQQLAGNLQLNIIPITAEDLERFLAGRYPSLIESLASMRSMTPQPNPPAPPKESRAAKAPSEAEQPEPEEPQPQETRPQEVRSPEIRKAPQVAPSVEKPKVAIPASVDQWVGFKDAHLLLIEGLKRQVIELDAEHKEVWSFKGALIGYAAHLPSGNYLMVDLGNHRVFEMDDQRHILWQFGDPQDRQKQLRSPRGASRIANGNTLIVDTGNHRVLEVDAAGEIIWQYGETGRAGCSGQSLFKPHWARRLSNGNTLIVDTGNHRVLEVDVQKNVIWQYGNSVNRLGSGQGSGLNQLSEPSCATLLSNGHYLIVDTGNQRVLEVDALRQLIWHYRPGAVKGGHAVKDPLLAARLDNGRTLVVGRQSVIEVDAELQAVWDNHKDRDPQTPSEASVVVPARLGVDLPPNLLDSVIIVDRNASRLVEADRKKQIVWQYSGLVGGDKNRLLHPHYAVRLASGNTLAADTGNHRVVEIRDNAVLWQFGRKGEQGDTMKQLSYPHSAERSVDGRTLIADTNNRRVLEVNSAGDVVWLKTELANPYYAIRLPGGRILVTLWGSHQIVELDDSGRVVWFYGQAGFAGHGPNQLFHPEFATRLENGNTLIADTQNHRVLEVNSERHVVWQYGGAPEFLGRIGRFGVQLNTPVACWRLPEGNTVVIHAGKNHAVELDPELNILWQYTLQ